MYFAVPLKVQIFGECSVRDSRLQPKPQILKGKCEEVLLGVERKNALSLPAL